MNNLEIVVKQGIADGTLQEKLEEIARSEAEAKRKEGEKKKKD